MRCHCEMLLSSRWCSTDAQSTQHEHRCSNDICHCNQQTCFYKKLFRVDRVIDTATWNALVSGFYYDNELVLEYLNSV